jgi:hypothetical protein
MGDGNAEALVKELDNRGVGIICSWKTEDYPWINFWRSMSNYIPVALGMEFGTTGMHEPFPVIAKKGKIFGCNSIAL